MKWLIPLLVLSCSDATTAPIEPPAAVNPKAVELHTELFAAADNKKTQAFKKLFTPASRELLNRYFASVNSLPRPQGSAALGWDTFVEQHARLPKRARQKTPYPLAEIDGQWWLDITAHVDALFFGDLLPNQ